MKTAPRSSPRSALTCVLLLAAAALNLFAALADPSRLRILAVVGLAAAAGVALARWEARR